MKIWFGFAVLLISLSFTACTHESKENLPLTVAPVAPGCAELSQIICTREYVPTNCVMGKEQFSGTNACEARKLAKAYACEKNVAYVETAVSCSAKAVADAQSAKDADACAGDAKPCTREYRPQVCRLGEVLAKGNNHCEALNALKTSVCSKKLVFNEEEAACEAANSSPSQKAKRSR